MCVGESTSFYLLFLLIWRSVSPALSILELTGFSAWSFTPSSWWTFGVQTWFCWNQQLNSSCLTRTWNSSISPSFWESLTQPQLMRLGAAEFCIMSKELWHSPSPLFGFFLACLQSCYRRVSCSPVWEVLDCACGRVVLQAYSFSPESTSRLLQWVLLPFPQLPPQPSPWITGPCGSSWTIKR